MVSERRAIVPDGWTWDDVCAATTHVAIAAHPDDLEIVGLPAIIECHDDPDRWFTGIVCTDGAGGPRPSGPRPSGKGPVDPVVRVDRRWDEQVAAAGVGRYAAVAGLGWPSPALRGDTSAAATRITSLLGELSPRHVFTHNPFDAHRTHRAVVAAAVDALNALPAAARPDDVAGIEVWRGLDWVPADHRRDFSIDDTELAARLWDCFPSQVSGGKRYDRAFAGRHRANATLDDPNAIDVTDALSLGVDLSPLIGPDRMPIADWTAMIIEEFAAETAAAWSDRPPGPAPA